MTFLETVVGDFNRMRASAFSGDYEGVTHAGIALVHAGEVFLAQRTMDETDDPDVQETWEFPGGHLDPGEQPYEAALREFLEETGLTMPIDATVINGWRSSDGVYQGFVVSCDGSDLTEWHEADWMPTSECQAVGWFTRETLPENLRPVVRDDTPWDLIFGVSGNEESMTDDTESDYADLHPTPMMVHGVLAPESVPSGDQRGFMAGAVTRRPLRLPLGWQEWTASGHDSSITIGSVDRMMRKDGLIHWEGMLMTSPKADEFTDLLAFFGQYGVSVDGLKGNIDMEKSAAEGMVWFDAVQVGGAVACSVPAFAEAYVALGPHPDMPADSEPETLAASGLSEADMIGSRMEFKRGPGWVTDPKATNRIHDYWTKPGQPGYEKVAWGTPGDFARAKALIGEKIAKHSPDKMRFLNQIIAQWHHDALGYWPSTHAKMLSGGKTKASGVAMEFKKYDAEARKKAHTLPDGSFPIEDCVDLKNAIQAIGRAKDPAKAKAHIRSRKAALGCSDVTLPWSSVMVDASVEGGFIDIVEDLFDEAYAQGRVSEIGLRDDGAIIYELSEPDDQWEVVLTSSGKSRVLPPSSYFEQHPSTENCVIEEPDENGFQRTYGYAAEWGVCHIGHDGVCVEPPEPDDDTYPYFHLGRTKTTEGYIKTGLITYAVEHRSAREILAQTPQQAHFEDLSRAWAAVRCGHDERGIWFSGVVLPTVEEKWLVAIEASGQVSGEWKHGYMRTLLTVNVPGYPVVESSAVLDDDGNVLALAASAFQNTLTASVNHIEDSECKREEAAARMGALRLIDAEVRFAALREQFLAEREEA
jgi:8-oxo-dGTP pyrophosphatase MutT (NUDIX family)